MLKPRLVRLAEKWKPSPEDPFGEDQRRLVTFLLERSTTWQNPIPIDRILKEAGFVQTYSRSAFQHRLLGPLRRRRDVFIGTGGGGLYLVLSAEDAHQTLAFYTTRIRSELRHARNLRILARRSKLFQEYAPQEKKRPKAIIYIDESGTPALHDAASPVFVVAAVVIESRRELATLEQRFKNASALIGRPPDQELRASGLSKAKHRRVLRELSPLEYQWAAACFVKSGLSGAGFEYPKTFYKYALQFLIGDLLTIAWAADLVIDEYSSEVFQAELELHLRRQNSGLPIQRLNDIAFAQSSRERLVQLADLVAGAVRLSASGERAPLEQISDKMLSLQYWPPPE